MSVVSAVVCGSPLYAAARATLEVITHASLQRAPSCCTVQVGVGVHTLSRTSHAVDVFIVHAGLDVHIVCNLRSHDQRMHVHILGRPVGVQIFGPKVRIQTDLLALITFPALPPTRIKGQSDHDVIFPPSQEYEVKG